MPGFGPRQDKADPAYAGQRNFPANTVDLRVEDFGTDFGIVENRKVGKESEFGRKEGGFCSASGWSSQVQSNISFDLTC